MQDRPSEKLVIDSIMSDTLIAPVEVADVKLYIDQLLADNTIYQNAKKNTKDNAFFGQSYLLQIGMTEAKKVLKERPTAVHTQELDTTKQMSHMGNNKSGV